MSVRNSRAADFVVALRLDESLMLLGIPVLGYMLGQWPHIQLPRLGLLLVASFIGAAHLYLLNDQLGYQHDRQDPKKAQRPLIAGSISQRDHLVYCLSLGAMTYGFVYLFLPLPALVLTLCIEVLWLVYEWPPLYLKRRPVFSTLCNFFGTGFFPFLIGYVCSARLDLKGVCLAVYAGLLSAAGQLNRETIDVITDRNERIYTTATWLGESRTHAVSFAAFFVATLYLGILLWFGMTPPELVLPVLIILPLHAFFFLRARKTLFRAEAVRAYIGQYRALYGAAGVAFLIGWSLV